MGQKVHPVGFRTAIMIPHKSRWYASKKEFSALLLEDFKIRNFIKKHPNDRLTADAGYWLGETMFQRQKYREAAEVMAREGTPLSDHRASAAYRRAMLRTALLNVYATNQPMEVGA